MDFSCLFLFKALYFSVPLNIMSFVTNTLEKALSTCYHFQSDTFPVEAFCNNTGGIQSLLIHCAVLLARLATATLTCSIS